MIYNHLATLDLVGAHVDSRLRRVPQRQQQFSLVCESNTPCGHDVAYVAERGSLSHEDPIHLQPYSRFCFRLSFVGFFLLVHGLNLLLHIIFG